MPERAFETPPRAPFASDAVRDERGRARVLAAIRGDPSLGLSAFERIPVVVRAFDLLGAEAGEALLGVVGGAARSVVDPEHNVVRAAYWTLQSRPDGVALASKAAFDRTRATGVRAVSVSLLAGTPGRGRFQPLLDALAEPDPKVAEAAAWALADHRWDAGPEFLRLLDDARGQDAVVAWFFEAHLVEGSVSGLLKALKRAAPGTSLRGAFSKALQTQTGLTEVGVDPVAWERAVSAQRPK